MSIETFIKAAREYSEEIDDYFSARPELFIALTNDAVRIDKVFELVPSFSALLQRYGLKKNLEEEFFLRDRDFSKQPSSLRLLAQVFGHPWQHVNLEQALAEAVAATRISLGLDDEEKCSECDSEEAPISVGITPEGNLAYVVSDEPLNLQEEAKFLDTLRGNTPPIPLNMWSEAAGIDIASIDKLLNNSVEVEAAVVEHDPVNKPKHYTSHPSGVECIELSEKMSFNLGNAFKYVFRRDDKENALQDVSKAEWYLKREISRLEKLVEEMPASVEVLIHPNLSISDYKKANRVIAAEANPNAADYYVYLFDQESVASADDLISLRDALECLQALIEDVRQSVTVPE